MPENWYALVIAILLNQPPEAAFQIYSDGFKSRNTSSLNDADTLDMIGFRREGLTYKAIGEMYGLKDYVVYKRIKYYNEHKRNRPTAMESAS